MTGAMSSTRRAMCSTVGTVGYFCELYEVHKVISRVSKCPSGYSRVIWHHYTQRQVIYTIHNGRHVTIRRPCYTQHGTCYS